MISYEKGYGGIWLLMRMTGTAWPHGVAPGLIAMAISLAMSSWPFVDDFTRDRELFIGHPYAMRMFTMMLGMTMVFKTNFAYQRYWEAAGALQMMAAKWLDGALMAICFDAGGSVDDPLLHAACDYRSRIDHPQSGEKGGRPHADYANEIAHLTSLMHALALQHLRADDDLDNLSAACSIAGHNAREPTHMKHLAENGMPLFKGPSVKDVYSQQKLAVLGGVTPEERKALEADCMNHILCTEARVAMAESWLMRRMLARQKFEQGESAVTSPPILSRLYQVISDGTLQFGVACKSATVPFPFPYQNILHVFLWMFTVVAPALVNGIIFDVGLRAVFSFLAVAAYHTLRAIGDNLEDPYIPYDPNELPLPALQHQVNMRLYSYGMVYGVHHQPQPEPAPTKPDIVSDDQKMTGAVNGNGTANGHANGHGEKLAAANGSIAPTAAPNGTSDEKQIPAAEHVKDCLDEGLSDRFFVSM